MADGEVLVAGAGLAGVACARVLHDAGVPVQVRELADCVGGRLATQAVGGRPVDVGAAYCTAESATFVNLVAEWVARGLVREWTDTFLVTSPDGPAGTTSGLMRYAATHGLASLPHDLARDLEVRLGHGVSRVAPGPLVDGEPFAAVALAMPGPQAWELLDPVLVEERAVCERLWEPCLTLVATWDRRDWRAMAGAFVADSAVLTWVTDDGSRQADGAPVLVAHSDPVLAAVHLDDPAAAVPVLIAELRQALRIEAEPVDVVVRAWPQAKPMDPQEQPFHLGPARIGLCGDGWHGRPRIEAAYLSGHALGRALVRLLGADLR